MDVTEPYACIRFVAMDVTEPYEFIGGDIHGPKPYKFIGFGDIHGPRAYAFTGFGDEPPGSAIRTGPGRTQAPSIPGVREHSGSRGPWTWVPS